MSEANTTKPVFTGGFKILAAANVIEALSDDPKRTFSKLWIYPALGHAAGKLALNVGDVYVGKRGAGPKVTPDKLASADLPLVFELQPGQSLKLEDILLQADNAADGVFFCYT